MAPRDFQITPQRWLPRGEAMVQGSQKQLVIWNAIPGEPALVHLFHEGMHQDLARVIRPAGRPHPWRRTPPCDRFNVCGGCPLMHLVPEGQADVRLQLVRDALAEYGLQPYAPRTLIASPAGDRDFRYTARVAAGLSDEGHLRVGAYSRGSHHVVPIPECQVTTPLIREAMKVVAHHVRDLGLYPYEPDKDRGLLRYVILRQSRLNNELLVTIVAARKVPVLWELAEAIASGLNAVVGVHLHINDGPGNAIFLRDSQGTGDTTRMRGKDTIEEALGDIRLRVGPGDFYQTNPAMAEVIVADIVKYLDDYRDHPAVDLYCGVGGITLTLAKTHGYAFGVEVLPGAVERARENALHNKVSAEFAAGEVVELLPEIARRLQGTAPVVNVDPARRGLEPAVIDGILKMEPVLLTYLSCNPRTMARDLAEFVANGWKVDDLRAYDMFPQTSHVELLARLSPPEAPAAARRPPRRKVVRD